MQFYWNHNSAWRFLCKFPAYLQKIFFKDSFQVYFFETSDNTTKVFLNFLFGEQKGFSFDCKIVS